MAAAPTQKERRFSSPARRAGAVRLVGTRRDEGFRAAPGTQARWLPDLCLHLGVAEASHEVVVHHPTAWMNA